MALVLFVVLPLAFAAAAPEQAGGVPAAALVPAVIVTQTLVELVYVRIVPRLSPVAPDGAAPLHPVVSEAGNGR